MFKIIVYLIALLLIGFLSVIIYSNRDEITIKYNQYKIALNKKSLMFPKTEVEKQFYNNFWKNDLFYSTYEEMLNIEDEKDLPIDELYLKNSKNLKCLTFYIETKYENLGKDLMKTSDLNDTANRLILEVYKRSSPKDYDDAKKIYNFKSIKN